MQRPLRTIETQCVVAGGGPAGLMLAVLLARAGVCVAVLEKHGDFLRDFRGDTIHPSTLEVLSELGLDERLLKIPHEKVKTLVAQFGETPIEMADFTGLPVRHHYIAMMPQWDFLNLLAEEGERYPGFTLLMQTEAEALIEQGGKVVGITAQSPDGPIEIRAPVVVGADGRGSVLRQQSGLEIESVGAPMDVLWFRLPRRPTDTSQTQARFVPGRIFIMLNRGDYWQCAFVIPKGSRERLMAGGFSEFRKAVGASLPFDATRGEEIPSWDDVKLLVVKVDRLKRWTRPGLLFIGDAAHAMSPVGGVGVNLAVQDAVAAANILAKPLREGRATFADLEAVQKRREFPTHMTQRLQVMIQNAIISRALNETDEVTPPLALRLISGNRWLRRVPARLFGLGVRPEHVAGFIRDAAPPAQA